MFEATNCVCLKIPHVLKINSFSPFTPNRGSDLQFQPIKDMVIIPTLRIMGVTHGFLCGKWKGRF